MEVPSEVSDHGITTSTWQEKARTGRRTVAQFAHQIKRALSSTVLNDLGRRVGFCHRERLMTPYRLVLSLLAGHATGTVETLADMQRQFNALFGTTVAGGSVPGSASVKWP